MDRSHFDAGQAFRAFERWLETPLGQYVLAHESSWFERAVTDIFGFNALQIELCALDSLRANRMPWRLRAGLGDGAQLRCQPEALPFREASLDLVTLPHGFDFCADPHQVAREVARVLRPEGRLLITGFNPWSLFGLKRLKRDVHGPWQGHFVAPGRLRDWLQLLELEVCRTEYFCYRLPTDRGGWLNRSAFLDNTSERFLPATGAVYGIEVVKRVTGMRIIEPQWQRVPAGKAAPVTEKRQD
ncbi:class I SAM-dependent methyltransferase [Chitinibacteraceae bacterium HSL-7]